MNEQEYRQTFKEDQAVGWEAIDAVLKALYGDIKPRHYGSIIKYILGGDDPLDGSSIYDCEEQTFHRHIVSYGMSELYFNPELAGADYSKWGFEFTFRTPPYDQDPDSGYNTKHEPYWQLI